MWQGMLKSAGLTPTHHVLYHGFITSGGQKMSKSLGNVISPFDLIEKYGTDATRYLLLRHVHPFEDTDITWERMDEWFNANLANGLGNLVSRVMKMSETYVTEEFKESDVSEQNWQSIYSEHYTQPFDRYNLQEVMDVIWLNIQKFDEYIADTEPFKVVKTDIEKGKAHIKFLREGLYTIACRLEPMMPETARTIKIAIVTNKKPETLFQRIG
jgi:methionyl-tRNA synthetase